MSQTKATDADLYALTRSETRAKASKYTHGSRTSVTAEGGTVGLALDAQGNRYVAHTGIPTRRDEAISAGAFTTAMADWPVESVARVFAEDGNAKKLIAALEKAQAAIEKGGFAPVGKQ